MISRAHGGRAQGWWRVCGPGLGLLLWIAACATPAERAERVYRQGEIGEAIALWEEIPETSSQYARAQVRLMLVKTEFARLLKRYQKQAEFFESEGRLAEAALYFRLAYKLDRGRSDLLDRVQSLMRELDRRVRAEREGLEAAVESGDLRRARNHAARLERLDPFDPRTQVDARHIRNELTNAVSSHLVAGRQAYASRDDRRARTAFEAALRLDPRNGTARGYLAYIDAASTGQSPAPRLPATLTEGAVIAEGHLLAGQEAELAGEPFRALEGYEAALRADPGHVAATQARDRLRIELEHWLPSLYEAGKRYFQDEDLHNAMRVWHRMLMIDPDDPRARENVARAERILARLEEIQTDGP